MKTIFVAFMAAVSAIATDTTFFPYNGGNECASCIIGGNDYCIQGSDN